MFFWFSLVVYGIDVYWDVIEHILDVVWVVRDLVVVVLYLEFLVEFELLVVVF